MNLANELEWLKEKEATLSPSWKVFVLNRSKYVGLEEFGQAAIENINKVKERAGEMGIPFSVAAVVEVFYRMLKKMVEQKCTKKELMKAAQLCSYLLEYMLEGDPQTKESVTDFFLEIMNRSMRIKLPKPGINN